MIKIHSCVCVSEIYLYVSIIYIGYGQDYESSYEKSDNVSVDFNSVDKTPKCTIAQTWQIFRQCLVEAIATGMLTFVIVRIGDLPTSILSDLATPLTLTLGIWLAGPISGGHVNPAVTLGAVLARLMCPCYLGFYWASQFGGGIAGAAIAKAYQTVHNETQPGTLIPASETTLRLRFVSELMGSSVFVLMVLCSADPKRPVVWLSSGFTTSLVAGLTALLAAKTFVSCKFLFA